MNRSTWLAVLSVLVLVLGVGCGGEETHREANQGPEQGAGATVEEAEPGPTAEDAGYQLRATASGPYTVGQQGTFEIVLTPRGQYHVNDDPNFPFAITLAGPSGVSFAESSLDREDAAEFTQQRARFAVPFTPSAAGEQRVTATVDFAVCTATTCLPEQRTLALALPVQ